MKRRSGNGTAAKQYLYIFWNIPFIWIVKIGIAGNVTKRVKDVNKSSPGWDIPIWFICIPFAWQLEQWLHRRLSFLQVPFKGSGHTERFFILAAVPAILFSFLVFLTEWAIYFTLAFVLLWLLAGKPSIV